MLVIKSVNSVEPITNYRNLKIEEERNGIFSISFDALNTDNNAHAYDSIQEESIVEYDGHEYRIKQMSELRSGKSITAVHTFFDLGGDLIDDMQGGTITIDQAFSFLLNGTGWTYEIIGNFPHEFVPNFGNDNVLSLIWTACDAFDANVKIERNKHLKIGKQLGMDDDFQFRYQHNIKTLKRSVDTSNFATRIIGRGAERLKVEYISPLEEHYAQTMPDFKPIYAESIKDDRITQSSTMIERLKRELRDVPEINIEVETLVLGDDRNVHDSVWLIYEPLGIELKSQIIKKTTYPHAPHKNTVELGNKKDSFADLLTEVNVRIDENNKEVRSRIEQTNDRIAFEIQEIGGQIAGIEITVGQISSYVDNEIDRLDDGIANNSSLITQTASQIRSEVNQEITRIDGDIANNYSAISQTATQIRSEVSSDVTRLDGRIDSSNSSISQLSNEISMRVTEGEVESIFEQKAGSFTFTANQINFDGAVFGNSSATFLGTIETGQDVKVGDRITVGNLTSGARKELIFHDTSRIYSQGSADTNLTIDSDSIILNGHVYLGFAGGSGQIYTSGSDLIVKNGSSELLLRSNGPAYLLSNGSVQHAFYSDGSYANRTGTVSTL